MRYYIQAPLIILVALLQVILSPHIAILNIKPDLMLLSVLSWAVLSGLRNGLFWAVFGGTLMDIYSGAPFGLHLASFTTVTLLAVLLTRNLLVHNLFPALAAAFLGTLVFDTLFLLVIQTLDTPVDWSGTLGLVVVPAAVLNGLVMPFVYWPFYQLHQRLVARETA